MENKENKEEKKLSPDELIARLKRYKTEKRLATIGRFTLNKRPVHVVRNQFPEDWKSNSKNLVDAANESLYQTKKVLDNLRLNEKFLKACCRNLIKKSAKSGYAAAFVLIKALYENKASNNFMKKIGTMVIANNNLGAPSADEAMQLARDASPEMLKIALNCSKSYKITDKDSDGILDDNEPITTSYEMLSSLLKTEKNEEENVPVNDIDIPSIRKKSSPEEEEKKPAKEITIGRISILSKKNKPFDKSKNDGSCCRIM